MKKYTVILGIKEYLYYDIISHDAISAANEAFDRFNQDIDPQRREGDGEAEWINTYENNYT